MRTQQEQTARSRRVDVDPASAGGVPADLFPASGPSLLAGLVQPDPSTRGWWASSFEQVLDGASALLDCADPEELDQAAADLLGTVLADRLERERSGFDLFGWMDGLVAAAAERAAEPGTWFLLHALAAICPSWYQPGIKEALTASSGPPDTSVVPGWLERIPRFDVRPTAHLLVDGYGCRYGLLLHVVRPAGATRTYLIDVDPCSPVAVPLAGLYPDDDAAVAAWRAQVGPSAEGVAPRPAPVDVLARTLPTPQLLFGGVLGNETARQLSEFYRTLRLVESLTDALVQAGTPLPDRGVAEKPVPVAQTVAAFLRWCREQGLPGHAPESVEWVAEDWGEFQPDPAALGPSPHRIASFVLHLLEFYTNVPERDAAVAVVPDWIRYCVQACGLPEQLARPALDLADRVADDPASVAALSSDLGPPPLSETTGQAAAG